MTRAVLAIRIVGFVLVLVLIGVVALSVGLPTRGQLRASFGGSDPWAAVAFAGLYAAVSLSPLPKTVFTLAAGAIFGSVAGLVAVLAGATAGSIVAFFLGRRLGRAAVASFVALRIERVDRLLAGRGFTAVLVARLIPVVPFTGLNYVAGLTAVRLRDFVAGTVLGMIPATGAYVTIGAYGNEPGSWPMWAAIGTLVLLTGAGLALSGWRRRGRRSTSTGGNHISGSPADVDASADDA